MNNKQINGETRDYHCSHCGKTIPCGEQHMTLKNYYGLIERLCSFVCQQERRRSMAGEFR